MNFTKTYDKTKYTKDAAINLFGTFIEGIGSKLNPHGLNVSSNFKIVVDETADSIVITYTNGTAVMTETQITKFNAFLESL